MKKTYYLIPIVLLVVGLFAYYYLNQENKSDKDIIKHLLNEKGESKTIYIPVGSLKGTKQSGVKITITNIITEEIETNTSDENGVAEFTIIVGDDYIITAEYQNITASLSCNIGPKDEIGVIYHEDKNELEVICVEVGTL